MHHGLILGYALLVAGLGDPAAPPDDLPAYREARAAAGRDPDANVRLALWCEARGLDGLRAEHLEAAIREQPDHPIARGLLGMVKDEGEWLSPARAIDRAKSRVDRAEALGRYESRREQVSDTAQAHWQLAGWCEESGLSAEVRAHLRAVVRIDPSRDEAWKKLGYRRQVGRWATAEQLAAEKTEAEARRKADAKWRPLLARWKTQLGQRTRRAEAEASLGALTDPRAVPSIWKVFASGSLEDQGLAVRLLGQVDAPAASRALASLAMFGSSEVVRRSAAETLAGRDPRECAGWLIGLLRDSIPYEVKPVGGPGSPGELYVQGRRANTRRFYSAPPSMAPLRPDDVLGLDDNGFVVAHRNVGYTDRPLAAALDPLFQGAPDLSTLGPVLAHAGLGERGMQIGRQALQNQHANSDLIGKIQHSSSSTRSAAGVTFNTPVQSDIPVGQLMMQSQIQAEASRLQLQRDVDGLARYNADVDRVNGRAAMALKVAAGDDRGPKPDAWRRWAAEIDEMCSSVPPRSRDMLQDDTKPPASNDARARLASFGKGTPVWTRSGLRPVDDLRAGDLVLTQDPAGGALAFEPILTIRRAASGLARPIAIGEATIVATDLERLWRPGRGWIVAGELRPGDPVRTLGGLARVTLVGDVKPQPVFHVQVFGGRGIFVGPAGILAHDDRVHNPVPVPFDSLSGDRQAARAD